MSKEESYSPAPYRTDKTGGGERSLFYSLNNYSSDLIAFQKGLKLISAREIQKVLVTICNSVTLGSSLKPHGISTQTWEQLSCGDILEHVLLRAKYFRKSHLSLQCYLILLCLRIPYCHPGAAIKAANRRPHCLLLASPPVLLASNFSGGILPLSSDNTVLIPL